METSTVAFRSKIRTGVAIPLKVFFQPQDMVLALDLDMGLAAYNPAHYLLQVEQMEIQPVFWFGIRT